MLDALREEEIVNKVGGRFKLSTLIQKRLVALNGGSRPLVDVKTGDKMEIVVQEILQDKIFLDELAAPSEDKALGEGGSKHWTAMRKGLDWFRQHNAKAYMVLLD